MDMILFRLKRGYDHGIEVRVLQLRLVGAVVQSVAIRYLIDVHHLGVVLDWRLQ
jgi:hypothetical protein